MDKIYLIGFMGSGKTTFGKKLARKLNLNFVDLDYEIEKDIGYSISEFFNKHGENNFRQIEQKKLIESFTLSRTLISTGGGTPCFYNNISDINENGLSIYLKAEVKLLSHRLLNSKEQRPLIKDKSKDELEKYIEKLLSEREKYYLSANLIVNAKNININKIAEEIRNLN